jgi:small subunit ribosomal protein S17
MARTITGTVVSDKADKTIVISVAERKTHPLYKKQYTINTKFMAHDEKNEAKVGDKVLITECRPLSARKRFALQKVVERAGVAFREADAAADIVPDKEPAKEKK